MISGAVHTAFPIDDPSRVGEARRHAARLAAELDWGDVDAGRLALVVTELGSNLERHAKSGRLLVACDPNADEIEVIAIDHGPGVASVDRCLGDGFSTGGSPGTGLGAVKRLSQDFDIHSSVPDGTVAVARLRRKPTCSSRASHGVQVRGISIAAPGETACGDAWTACLDSDRAAVMVADGLGHGPDASKAAQAAMAVFSDGPFDDLREGIQRAHVRLRTTRGAAISSLRLDAVEGKVRGAGAGNVLARVVSGVSDRSMLSQHGTVGVQMRRLEEAEIEWPPHALVIVHTDGIEARWSTQRLLPVLGRDPALVAAILLRDHCRGRDDATVVVLRRKD